jgi:hypothetical protein
LDFSFENTAVERRQRSFAGCREWVPGSGAIARRFSSTDADNIANKS